MEGAEEDVDRRRLARIYEREWHQLHTHYPLLSSPIWGVQYLQEGMQNLRLDPLASPTDRPIVRRTIAWRRPSACSKATMRRFSRDHIRDVHISTRHCSDTIINTICRLRCIGKARWEIAGNVADHGQDVP